MAVTIRLQRAGARNRPFYRVVVADSRRARDGAFIERLGYYDPIPNPEVISIEIERAQEWIRKGAQPSDAVRTLMRRQEKRQASGELPPARPRTSSRPTAPLADAPAPAEVVAPAAVSEASAAPDGAPPEESATVDEPIEVQKSGETPVAG